MGKESEIRAAMRQLCATTNTIMGEVTEVDADARTCTITDDGIEMFGIRLQTITPFDSGLVLYPAIGSVVLAVRIEESDEWVVISSSKIDRVLLQMGERSVEIDQNNIVFNEGTIGLAKADVLTQKINALENQLNSVVTALKTVSITLAPSGTYPLAPHFATINNLTPTKQSEVEDTTIKH